MTVLLWRTVVYQAMQDALGQGSSREEQEEAIRWFCDQSSPHFHDVCDLANLNSGAVRDQFFRMYLKSRKRTTKNRGKQS